MSESAQPHHEIHPYSRSRISVGDAEMAYVDTGGENPPIVFIHGNPTSSYLWRNIIPHVEEQARCLAPDMIGMGESDPAPDGCYRFVDHAQYLDTWFEKLDLTEEVTLVIHDWGGAYGFYRAYRFPEQIRGIAYMEPVLLPWNSEDFEEGPAEVILNLREPQGDHLGLKENLFVEEMIPGMVLRDLSQREMEHYRRPYTETGFSRMPTLSWPRELPIDGVPGDVHDIGDKVSSWLETTDDLPKLFVNTEPGVIMDGQGPDLDFYRRLPNQTEIQVEGLHYVQEDSPHEIGEALSDFYAEL